MALASKIHPLASHLWEKKSDTLRGGRFCNFLKFFLKLGGIPTIPSPLLSLLRTTLNKLEGVFFKTSLRFSKTVSVLFVPTLTFLPKMPKDKKKEKVPNCALPLLYSAKDIPSQDCKDFLIELIVRYYEDINLRSLESTYVRYREEGLEMFKHDMHIRMIEHLMAPQ